MTTTTTAGRLTGVDGHLHELLALATPMPTRRQPVSEAAGLVLAADVRAPGPLPAFDNSAMDGYAIRAHDVVVGAPMPAAAEIAAGDGRSRRLEVGCAVPIMTGAPIPDGADAVVPVELAVALGAQVAFLHQPRRGDHIRRRGEEQAAGAMILSAGREVSAVSAGGLAAAGVCSVPVRRRPRVAVLSTGRELVTSGAASVHDANTPMLSQLLQREGAEVTALPPCDDDADVVREALVAAAAQHDLLVTAGGISQGTHEVIRQALIADAAFRTVAMTPGSPQGFGRLAGTPVIALPGNPSAALVSCCAFVRPVVRAMRGLVDPAGGWVSLRMVDPPPRADRTRFLPVVIEHRDGVTLARVCGSHHRLSTFAGADAVLRLPAGDASATALPLL